MKNIALLFIAFLIGTFVTYSQKVEQVVSGNVIDGTTGEPLPGANISIAGVPNGVTTDSSGMFHLKHPEPGMVIAFSYIGYETEWATYTGQPVINVRLLPSVKALDEVVVVGYGVMKKSDLTGAISQVHSTEIERVTPVNIESVLQGRVPGMMVTANSGAPGSEAIIRIRGIGTVNNNNPVYVVDGVFIDNADPNNPASNISFLNPWDIESVEVLKDASAQAIYGSRGANGVILITTKKGREGLPKVSFSSSVGMGHITRMPKILNAEEFKNMILASHYNGYIQTHQISDLYLLPYPIDAWTKKTLDGYNQGINTNWLDEVLNTPVIQTYNLSIGGGSQAAHYQASAGYLNNEGLTLNTGYKRYSFRLNTDFKVGRFVTAGENLGITSSIKKGPDYSSSFYNALVTDPVTPVLKPDGIVDPNSPDYEYNKYQASIEGRNPVLEGVKQKLSKSGMTLVGNLFAEIVVWKDLKIRSSMGLNAAYMDESDFLPRFFISPNNQNQISVVSGSNARTNGWIWENTLTYNKTWKDHAITGLFGYTSEYTKATYQAANKKGTPWNYPELQTFDAATSDPNVTGGYNVLSMISWLGRINYSFRDKYLLTASFRRDGSSKFGAGHRWGTFPSFSLGWKISEEKFFKSLDSKFIDNLKFRAGWGQIGNSSLPVYNAYVSQVSSGLTDGWIDNRYVFGDIVRQGYFLKTIGTPDITWETSEQTNFGIDLSMMKNRLTLTADYYIRDTRDMLLQVPATYYAGYPYTASPFSNAGSVRNRGFELALDYRGTVRNFRYHVSMNTAFFKNEVTSLGQGNRPIVFYANRTAVGKPMGSFFGYVTDGIFQSEEEVQKHRGSDGSILQPYAHAGDFRFKNVQTDDVLDANDETFIGNPWPKMTYGFNINLEYKAFDLLAFFQGTLGNKIYRADFKRSLGFLGYQNTYEYVVENAWHGPQTSNSQPILTTSDQNDNYRNSDYFVEDGSYLRLKNVQLGYNLSKGLCNKVHITSGRFWIGGTNMLTFTKYRGIDPEVGASSTPTVMEGYDNEFAYPKTRELTLGVALSF